MTLCAYFKRVVEPVPRWRPLALSRFGRNVTFTTIVTPSFVFFQLRFKVATKTWPAHCRNNPPDRPPTGLMKWAQHKSLQAIQKVKVEIEPPIPRIQGIASE